MTEPADNATYAGTYEDPQRTIRPTPGHGSSDPLEALGALPRLSEGLIELRGTLGEGGMGVVRLGVQASLGRAVAVKMLREEHDTPSARRKILHEAWVTGTLEHPNVVPVYEVGQDAAGRPTLVLKRVEGRAWSELLADTEEPVERHLRVLLQVSNAMSFAHARGVLHRDLKPDNVMIGSYGEVYVVDWGIAVALDHGPVDRVPRASDQRAVAGTPHYMPPELLAEGGLPQGVGVDVYLLGGLLYEILHGRPPHAVGGPREGRLERILDHVRASDPPLDPSLPDEAARILRRALARDPGDRYPTVEDFRLDVERYVEHQHVLDLVGRAHRSLGRLEEVVEAGGDESVLALLGACRFGFVQALEAWPEAPGAREGLDRALAAAARHHLARGEWQAAELLLAEATTTDPELVERVRLGRDAERAELQRARHASDLESGIRTRTFVTGVVGAVWIGTPLAGAWVSHSRGAISYLEVTATALVLALLGVGLGFWARDSLSKSATNERVKVLIVTVPDMLLVATAGAWLLGLPAAAAPWLHLFGCGAMAFTYAMMLDRKLLPSALAYTGAFLAASARPEWVQWAFAIANLVLVAQLMWINVPHLQAARRP